jgi:hypothetical protein
MVLRHAFPCLLVLLLSSPTLARQIPQLSTGSSSIDSHPQRMNETVIPIHELKIRLGVQIAEGTGFCMDPACRFIGTDYHVAMIAQPRKIKGEMVVQRYLATGPDDDDATMNHGLSVGSLKYTLKRDLAVFELLRPLAHHHGIPFSLDELQPGQEVDIYAYPKEGINPVRSLLQFHGTFKAETPNGLLAFDYSLSNGKAIRPGASGGIVVDTKTQRIVGILNSLALDGEAVAMAVPVQSLVEFVTKVKPFLAASIFPSSNAIKPLSADIYPRFVPPITDGLQHRLEESPEIKALRTKAQALADGMRNYVAVQSLEWGSGNNEPSAISAYEVEVLNAEEQYREYPDGKKIVRALPMPALNTALTPGREWSWMPSIVGTQLGLKIQQAPDSVIGHQHIKVFQYSAGVEDSTCLWKFMTDYVFFYTAKTKAHACYGEVWTDENLDILRISEHDVMTGKWTDFDGVVTYGLLHQANESPRVIPVTFSTQARYNKKMYYCRGEFTNYRTFKAETRLISYK